MNLKRFCARYNAFVYGLYGNMNGILVVCECGVGALLWVEGAVKSLLEGSVLQQRQVHLTF